MSQRIKERIQRHTEICKTHSIPSVRVSVSEEMLMELILSEIEQAKQLGYDQALLILRHEVSELKEERHKLMVTADTLKASSDALTAAVTGAIALIGNPAASTPDTVVKQFQSDVDAQTARLNAAEAPPAPAPAPAPTP